jgi:hypothetical protein
MADTVITVLVLLLLFIGLPVSLLRIIDRTRTGRARHRDPSASQAAEREAYERRILAPDWVCVERHLRRPPPHALRDLYADRRLVTQRDLGYDDDRRISTFEPLDAEAMAVASQSLRFDAVVIATTDFGDAIYLHPGAGEADVVRVAYHDGGDIDIFAESIEAMVHILKRRHSSP